MQLTMAFKRLAALIFISMLELTTISHKILKMILWCFSNVLHHEETGIYHSKLKLKVSDTVLHITVYKVQTKETEQHQ
jgi:hypothetical protein